MTSKKTERVSDAATLAETADFPFIALDQTLTNFEIFKAILSILCLFLAYFLAQFDKFVLSYFTADILRDLSIGSSSYGLLTGYGTGILLALFALPVSYIGDRSSKRVLTLAIAIIWWSLNVIFQGLSNSFWQFILARIAMSIGLSAVEPLAVSLISDILPLRFVPIGESALYVGVYLGELLSGNIAHAFRDTNSGWRDSLKGVGIAGMVIAVILVLLCREPKRRVVIDRMLDPQALQGSRLSRLFRLRELRLCFAHIFHLRSFWIITFAASWRQISGNVFGFFFPSYLQAVYPSYTRMTSTYSIIAGVVGSCTVVTGGLLASWYRFKFPALPLYLAGVGGIVSSIFVVFMAVSQDMTRSVDAGLKLLFTSMAFAYLTAELWLGCIAALIVGLLPVQYKSVGFALYGVINVLIYSSGPEIVGIAQSETGSNVATAPIRYVAVTRFLLAIIIPFGYIFAGILFLLAARQNCYLTDLEYIRRIEHAAEVQDEKKIEVLPERPLEHIPKWLIGVLMFLICLVIGLLVASFVLRE